MYHFNSTTYCGLNHFTLRQFVNDMYSSYSIDNQIIRSEANNFSLMKKVPAFPLTFLKKIMVGR